MSGRLIATKLFVPTGPRRGVVARPRLVERLERGAEARLTLVSAPAGFGKTTLVAAWLGETAAADRAVAWVSLDRADNEPVSFWTYVVTALSGAVAGVGASALELIPSTVPITSALTTLLNDLAAVPGHTWLVLDDYHLIEHHAIREEMAFFLEHLPAQVHVVLLTRADPGLPLARWRVGGELVEIRADDLRFTPEEAGAYLNAVPGVALGADDVAVLEERTEGWIAALQLAALSLQGREDVSAFIARFTGDDRYIVDYLVDEVLQHQPEALRQFLLHTSVLDRLTGVLCDAVTGHDGGSSMLLTLERANLFTVALDDRREWYRYHHLFTDVLRARLLDEHPAEVPLLHQRASQWYESHDLADEAIDHALAGHDFLRAGHLMELAMPAVRRNRQDARMHHWLKALPEETVRRSPVLSVFYGNMLMLSGEPDAAELRFRDVERTLRAFADGPAPPWADSGELHTLPATIAIHRAALAQARGDLDGSTEHARRAFDLAGPDDHLARGGAAGFLGLVAWSRGDVATALDKLTGAVASLAAAGTRIDELTTTVALADLWLVAGRPRQARQLYEQGLQRARAWGAAVSRATAELEVGLGELDIESGRLDSAAVHLHAAASLDNQSSTTTGSTSRWFVARALLAQARGEPSEAVDLLNQAETLFRPGFFPDVRPLPALRARVWITQGRLSEAAEWAREQGISPTGDVSYLSEFEHLTLVRLLLAQHRDHSGEGAVEQAIHLLTRLQEAAQTGGRAGSLLEIRLLLALARDAENDRPRALETLAHALASAPEPDGHVRLFLDEGAPMRNLLLGLARRDKANQHLARLLGLSAPEGSRSTRTGQRLVAASADSLSGRELQVLRLLDSALTVPEIARELFVSLNTVRTHTKHIFTKLDATSRRAAVQHARERGLI